MPFEFKSASAEELERRGVKPEQPVEKEPVKSKSAETTKVKSVVRKTGKKIAN